MARQSRKATKQDYINALKHASYYHASSRDTKEKLMKEWQKYRQSYRERYGTPAPTVFQASRSFTERATETPETQQVPTIDFGMDYIRSFTSALERIYKDTLSYIDGYLDGTKHEEGKLASIASYHVEDITNSYFKVLQEIRMYLDSGVPAEVLAQAIANNIELDYTIAVELQPPSDIIILFDTTFEQLQGIWGQINAQMEELAQKAEDAYYER